MAAKKVVAKTKTTKAKTSSAKTATEVVKPGPEGKLLLTLTPISDALRAELRAQKSEAACEALGKNTSSAGVYREAGQFAVTMHRTLMAHGPAKVRYGYGLLVWFLECVRVLGVETVRQSSRANAASTSSLTGQLGLEVARENRSSINGLIELVIEGNAELEAGFAAVRGVANSEDDVITSLRSSADFAEKLLTKKAALAAEFGLTAEDVTAARTAAANAVSQRTNRSMDGAVKPKDDAATNRAEGRVLFEMRRAMRVFNKAAEKGFGARLVPGPATRNVLAPEKKKAAPKPV